MVRPSHRAVTIALTLAAAVSGCKFANTSSVKTLDAVGGSNQINQCGGNYPLAQSAAQHVNTPQQFSSTLIRVLGAVPTGLQQMFFDGANGSIEVVPSLDVVCGSVAKISGMPNGAFGGPSANGLNTASRQRILSCRKDLAGASKIYILADDAAIGHALVRAFAFFFSEVYLSSSPDAYAMKAEVGKALIANVASRTNSLALFRGMLPQPVLDQGGSQQLREQLLDNLQAPLDIDVRDAFYDLAVAESADSYLCNIQTRQTMMANGVFAQTGTAFNRIAMILDQLSTGNLWQNSMNNSWLDQVRQLYSGMSGANNFLFAPGTINTVGGSQMGNWSGTNWTGQNWQGLQQQTGYNPYLYYRPDVIANAGGELGGYGNFANTNTAQNSWSNASWIYNSSYNVDSSTQGAYQLQYGNTQSQNYAYYDTSANAWSFRQPINNGNGYVAYDCNQNGTITDYHHSNGGRYTLDPRTNTYVWFDRSGNQTGYSVAYVNGQWQYRNGTSVAYGLADDSTATSATTEEPPKLGESFTTYFKSSDLTGGINSAPSAASLALDGTPADAAPRGVLLYSENLSPTPN